MKLCNTVKSSGDVLIEVIQNGVVVDDRHIHNLITDKGVEHIANQLGMFEVDDAMNYVAIGSGTGQSEVDNTLSVELARVPILSRLQGTGEFKNDLIFTAEIVEGLGTGDVTEAGIFNDSSSGNMLCYTSFTAIEKLSNVTLNITWTISFLN